MDKNKLNKEQNNNQHDIVLHIELVILAILLLILIAIKIDSNAEEKNNINLSVSQKIKLCKAGISQVMGRSPNIMTLYDNRNNKIFYIKYTRSDDYSVWTYKCKIKDNEIIWGNPDKGGRWMNEYRRGDSKLTYKINGDELFVYEKYSDGSGSKKYFKFSQIR